MVQRFRRPRWNTDVQKWGSSCQRTRGGYISPQRPFSCDSVRQACSCRVAGAQLFTAAVSLAIDPSHGPFAVTWAGDGFWTQGVVQAGHLVRGQRDRFGGDVLFEILPAFRTRDRNDVFTLVQQPSERDLRR